jgi:hypothetical protein
MIAGSPVKYHLVLQNITLPSKISPSTRAIFEFIGAGHESSLHSTLWGKATKEQAQRPKNGQRISEQMIVL